MFFFINNRAIIILVSVLAIFSLFISTGYAAIEKKKILITITQIERGYVKAGKQRYLIVESTKVTDITGRKIPFYLIPVPGKAELILQPVPDAVPHVLEIIIQQEIKKKVMPE